MDSWQVFYFICYLIALLCFLVDTAGRLSSRIVWNSTWLTPLGLFFAFLPTTIATARTIG